MNRHADRLDGMAADRAEDIIALAVGATALREVEGLRALCAEVYQFAGCVDAPVRVLDNLSDAAMGRPLRHATILPVNMHEVATAEACSDLRAELAALREVDGLRARNAALLDKPEDLLWHAEDDSWWRWDASAKSLKRVDDPTPIRAIRAELATLREQMEDARTMANYLVGWWPGLEDAILWGENGAADNDAIVAARRILATPAPAGCTCAEPLFGTRPDGRKRCRLCNAEAPAPTCETCKGRGGHVNTQTCEWVPCPACKVRP